MPPEMILAYPAVTRNLHKNGGEMRGDLCIRGSWARGTDCIIDVRVTDTDAKSNLSRDPAKVLEISASCLAQRHHFIPFEV
jgi:hypothetical protein